jgi:hypothetical protein
MKLIKLINERLSKKLQFYLGVYLFINLIILLLSVNGQFPEKNSWESEHTVVYDSDDPTKIEDERIVTSYEKATDRFWPIGSQNIAYYDILEFIILGLAPIILIMFWHLNIKNI